MNYMSESIKELATALSQAQAEYPDIGKNREGRFNYEDKNHLKKAIDPVLKKYGLAVNSGLRIIDGNEYFFMMLMHTSGEYTTSLAKFEPVKGGGRSEDQDRGASITYISRYLYKEILGITIYNDKDDRDGEQKEDKKEKEEKIGTLSPKIGPDQVSELKALNSDIQHKIISFNKIYQIEDMTMQQYNDMKARWSKKKNAS